MDISRRGFLVGTLASFLATTVPGSLVAREYEDKIAKLIVLYDDIVEYKSRPDHTRQILSEKFVKVLNFTNANFKAPNTNADNLDQEELTEVSKMFKDTIFREKWSEIPPVMKEELIPVAVVIMLLSGHRLRFDPRYDDGSFGLFAERYHDVILNA